MTRPEDYRWTSYRATAGHDEAPAWLSSDEVLLHFGDQRESARERYRRFVDEGIGSNRCPWADLVGEMYLGSGEWLADVRERVESRARPREHPRAQRELLRPGMDAIVIAVANVLGVPEAAVRNGRGGLPRMIAAWIACYDSLLTNGEIAAALGLRSGAWVPQLVARCDRELRTSTRIRQCVEQCLSTLGRKYSKTTDLTQSTTSS